MLRSAAIEQTKPQPSVGHAPALVSGLSGPVDSSTPRVEREQKTIRQDKNLAPVMRHRLEVIYDELKFGPKKGEGSYGEVFEGEYRKNKVAIKVYDFRGMLADEQKGTLLREADLMEGLRSDYLVSLRGICFAPRYCLVMEYCDGGTLKARLDDAEHAIDPKQSLRWAQQISYGVYNLHSVRIIHSDLKGENILLDAHDSAKVADFGLSVLKSGSASQSTRAGGRAAGTLPWMAPELFEGRPNSTMSDVYSLGIVLWEIASRRSPFAGKMPAVITGMVLAGKREAIDPTWAPVFTTMIQACWQADPTQRPTAEQVGNEFKAALASLDGAPAALMRPAIPARPKSPLQVTQSSSVSSDSQPSVELSHVSQSLDHKSLDYKRTSKEFKLPDFTAERYKLSPEIAAQIKKIEHLQQELTDPKYKSGILGLEQRQKKEKLILDLETEKLLLVEMIDALQNPLIDACEQGDLEKVKALLRDGADPIQPNTQGKLPFCAAIYGMNQEVINYLRPRLGDLLLTWEQCVAHNQKYYGRTFYFPEAEEECIALLEKQKSKDEQQDAQLTRRHVEFEDVIDAQSIEVERKEVPACKSICCQPIHHDYYDEKGEYINHRDAEDSACANNMWTKDHCEIDDCVAAGGIIGVSITLIYWALYAPIKVLCVSSSALCCNFEPISHLLCCALPYCCCKTTVTITKTAKREVIVGERVKNSKAIAHTLWAEMDAIRHKQQHEVTSLAAPSRAQMQ